MVGWPDCQRPSGFFKREGEEKEIIQSASALFVFLTEELIYFLTEEQENIRQLRRDSATFFGQEDRRNSSYNGAAFSINL